METKDQSQESVDTGQPNTEPDKGTAVVAEPVENNGQAKETDGSGTTVTEPAEPSTQQAANNTFFDPANVPTELQGAYKDMQRAFTTKTKAIADSRQKIDAYDAFMADPSGQLKLMASQYGLQVVPNSGIEQSPINGGGSPENQSEPQTWDDVYKIAGNRIMGDINEKLRPLMESVHKTTATNIENQLKDIDPNWKLYEDEMQSNIKKHPTLVNDVSKLYQVSVPADVLNSRATKDALIKVEQKSKAAKMQGSRGVSRTEPAKSKVNSFQDAVDDARRQGRQEGWYK